MRHQERGGNAEEYYCQQLQRAFADKPEIPLHTASSTGLPNYDVRRNHARRLPPAGGRREKREGRETGTPLGATRLAPGHPGGDQPATGEICVKMYLPFDQLVTGFAYGFSAFGQPVQKRFDWIENTL